MPSPMPAFTRSIILQRCWWLKIARPPLLLRGGSGFLLFLLFVMPRGMVEGTCNGRVGADHPWPPVQSRRSGRRQANRRCPRSATSQPFQGDTHSRRVSGNETVPSPVAPQKQPPPRQVWRSNDCKELLPRWEKAIRCPHRCRQPFAVHARSPRFSR